ncbi:hypothetical protein C8Q74DRAFT_1249573 [Fomes fomentarius]|nr:hypothetical protein C8Q74DRAFT_1249573 [Fomes fomentarius]
MPRDSSPTSPPVLVRAFGPWCPSACPVRRPRPHVTLCPHPRPPVSHLLSCCISFDIIIHASARLLCPSCQLRVDYTYTCIHTALQFD